MFSDHSASEMVEYIDCWKFQENFLPQDAERLDLSSEGTILDTNWCSQK